MFGAADTTLEESYQRQCQHEAKWQCNFPAASCVTEVHIVERKDDARHACTASLKLQYADRYPAGIRRRK